LELPSEPLALALRRQFYWCDYAKRRGQIALSPYAFGLGYFATASGRLRPPFLRRVSIGAAKNYLFRYDGFSILIGGLPVNNFLDGGLSAIGIDVTSF